jgi:hypothetical protein
MGSRDMIGHCACYIRIAWNKQWEFGYLLEWHTWVGLHEPSRGEAQCKHQNNGASLLLSAVMVCNLDDTSTRVLELCVL